MSATSVFLNTSLLLNFLRERFPRHPTASKDSTQVKRFPAAGGETTRLSYTGSTAQRQDNLGIIVDLQ